jgi:hypothetical protein
MPAHPKVTNLHHHAVPNKDVGWLDVAMQDCRLAAVQVQQATRNAPHQRKQLRQIWPALCP